MNVYLLVTFGLVVFQQVYIRIAQSLNILDHPNQRSSHNTAVVRGGGIVIYFALVFSFFFTPSNNIFYCIGVTLIALIGFVDDLFSISRIIRLSVQCLAICLLFLGLPFDFSPLVMIILGLMAVGIINAYNFMDGINGISGIYAIVFLLSAYFVNRYLILFVDEGLILFLLISILVFGYYNFRKKARMFMGDVGSTTIAFVSLYLLGLIISITNDWSFILMMTVYGVDSVFTIITRLYRKENIFKAHRSHLYQYLANEAGMNHLTISLLYGLVQLIINTVVFWNYAFWHLSVYYIYLIVLTPASLLYWFIRYRITNDKILSEHA